MHQVIRTKDKSFLQRHRAPGGGWIYDTQGIEKVLYRLPELLAADPKRTVFVVEGEKDADNLAKRGFITTTNSGGAGKWKPEYSTFLRDRKVVVLPDNDEVGKKHAHQIAESVSPVARHVKIVLLPDLPEHGDVSDWLKAGGTRKELRKLVKAAPVFESPSLSREGIIFHTAKEISAELASPVEWVIPGLVATGSTTIVIGKVKTAGKTTLLTQMASAAIRGAEFMGNATIQTPVVYLTEQSEISFRVALKRAHLLGRRDFVFLLAHDVIGKAWEKVASAALKECKARGARLLIVDTIAAFARLTGADENEAGHALAAMRPLEEVTAAGIGVVIAQHERKGGGDVGDAGRGSSAWAGAADILLSLRRSKGRSAKVREIHALSRFDETPTSILVEFTSKGYVSHGVVRAIAHENAEKGLLKTLKTEKTEATTLQELQTATGESRATLQRVLKHLRMRGRVARKGRGTKHRPYRYWQLSTT